MRLETPLNIDFVKSKYVVLNVKQYDKWSRNIILTAYSQGKLMYVNKDRNYAYIRFKRPDEKILFNRCSITNDGKILVNLTDKMVDKAGRCCVDLIILSQDGIKYTINENELFVVKHTSDEEGNVKLEHYCEITTTDDGEGNVKIDQIISVGNLGEKKMLKVTDNPYPFVTDDDNGNVLWASVEEDGEIVIPDTYILSTMVFWLNVLEPSYNSAINILV